MAEFNNTWRKRLACQRCRHLKVRCEYSSPTNDTCIRCQKSNALCVIPAPKRNGGTDTRDSPALNDSHDDIVLSKESYCKETKEGHSAYLRRIIRDAEQKLSEMNVSPLSQAISSGLYSIEEVNDFYAYLLSMPNAFPAIQLLNLPRDIMELDTTWPWLAIAIVTATAMNTTGKPVREMQLFIQDLYKTGVDGHPYQVSLDRQLALAFMCQYAMSFHERGLNMLLLLHGLTVVTMKQLHKMGQFSRELLAAHVAAVTIMPYTIITQFTAIKEISFYYNQIVNVHHDMDALLPDLFTTCECTEGSDTLSTNQVLAAGAFMEAILTHNNAINTIPNATTLGDVIRIVDECMQSLDLLENHTLVIQVEFAKRNKLDFGNSKPEIPNSENLLLSPLQSTFLYAKMYLLKRAACRILDLRSCSDSEQCTEILSTIITQTAECGGQLFRAFAHINSQRPFVRTVAFYHVSDALLIMQLMRFIAFACRVNSDVRSECLLEVVSMKWEEMLKSSILVRQLYMLLFGALGMSTVKIGVYEKKTDSVIGSGSMPSFNVMYFDNRTRQIRETMEYTSQDLIELFGNASGKRELGSASPNWSEQADTPTLSTLLYLLINKL